METPKLPETDRLTIRHLTKEDKNALLPILGDAEVMKFSSTGPLSEEQIDEWLDERLEEYEHPGFAPWAVVNKDEDKLIGFCGFNGVDLDGQVEIELLYRFAKAYWGQGYASEAAEASKDFGMNKLAFNRIIAIISPENERSLRVAEKLEMSYEKDTVYKGFSARVYVLSKF